MKGHFQEYWGGIFKAHPWLAGPHQSYLGFSKRGGGACGEHSHAINIWQHFAHLLDLGKIAEVSAFMDFVDDGKLAIVPIELYDFEMMKVAMRQNDA